MKILVINAGSSSLKFQLFDMDNEKVIAKGNCEKIGLENSFIGYKTTGDKKEIFVDLPNHTVAVEKVFDILINNEQVIKDLSEIDAIGHRFVQGGWIFDRSVVIDDNFVKEVESKLYDISPLHAPANLAGYKG